MINETILNFNDTAFKIQTSSTAFDGADKTVTLSAGKVTESTGFNGAQDIFLDLIGDTLVQQWGSSATGIYFIKVI